MCHSSAYAAVKDLLAEEESEQRAGNATATERRKKEDGSTAARPRLRRATELTRSKAELHEGSDVSNYSG